MSQAARLTRLESFKITKGQIDFEKEKSSLVYPDDFDMPLIREFTNAYKRMRSLDASHSDEEILEQRKLGRRVTNGFEPNNACTLAFAKDPTREFSGCKIRFLRYDGDSEEVGKQIQSGQRYLD